MNLPFIWLMWVALYCQCPEDAAELEAGWVLLDALPFCNHSGINGLFSYHYILEFQSNIGNFYSSSSDYQ